MNAYGYTDENMLPLSKERALELMEPMLPCICSMMTTGSDAFERKIFRCSRYVAVERADWDRVRGEIPPWTMLSSSEKEQAFQNNPADAYAIYQLSP